MRGLRASFFLSLTKNNMKIFYILLISTLVLACKTPCKMKHKSESVTKNGAYSGILHLNENNCPLYIEVTGQPDSVWQFHTFYPIDLETKYKKKGLHMTFDITLLKAPNPEGCAADAVVTMYNINVVP